MNERNESLSKIELELERLKAELESLSDLNGDSPGVEILTKQLVVLARRSALDIADLKGTIELARRFVEGLSTIVPDTGQKQSDWAQTDVTEVDYIKNKPNLNVYQTKANMVEEIIVGDSDKYPSVSAVIDYVAGSSCSAIGCNPLTLTPYRYGSSDILDILTVQSTGLGYFPDALDYSKRENWYLIQTQGKSHDDPSNSDVIDIFVIYPTVVWDETEETYVNEQSSLMAAGVQEFIDIAVTIFDKASCNIYLPKYRQMNGSKIIDGSAFNYNSTYNLLYNHLPYKDIFNAFNYYLNNINRGRQFILFCQEQGSVLGYLMLRDIMGNVIFDIQQLMIKAVLAGLGLTQAMVGVTPYEFADSDDDIGKIAAWVSGTISEQGKTRYLWGEGPLANQLIINPLNWKQDVIPVPPENNAQAILRVKDDVTENIVIGVSGGMIIDDSVPSKYVQLYNLNETEFLTNTQITRCDALNVGYTSHWDISLFADSIREMILTATAKVTTKYINLERDVFGQFSPDTLPIATTESLGVVQVGTGLSIDEEGILSTTGGDFALKADKFVGDYYSYVDAVDIEVASGTACVYFLFGGPHADNTNMDFYVYLDDQINKVQVRPYVQNSVDMFGVVLYDDDGNIQAYYPMWSNANPTVLCDNFTTANGVKWHKDFRRLSFASTVNGHMPITEIHIPHQTASNLFITAAILRKHPFTFNLVNVHEEFITFMNWLLEDEEIIDDKSDKFYQDVDTVTELKMSELHVGDKVKRIQLKEYNSDTYIGQFGMGQGFIFLDTVSGDEYMLQYQVGVSGGESGLYISKMPGDPEGTLVQGANTGRSVLTDFTINNGLVTYNAETRILTFVNTVELEDRVNNPAPGPTADAPFYNFEVITATNEKRWNLRDVFDYIGESYYDKFAIDGALKDLMQAYNDYVRWGQYMHVGVAGEIFRNTSLATAEQPQLKRQFNEDQWLVQAFQNGTTTAYKELLSLTDYQIQNAYSVFHLEGNNSIQIYQKSIGGDPVRGLEINSSLARLYGDGGKDIIITADKIELSNTAQEIVIDTDTLSIKNSITDIQAAPGAMYFKTIGQDNNQGLITIIPNQEIRMSNQFTTPNNVTNNLLLNAQELEFFGSNPDLNKSYSFKGGINGFEYKEEDLNILASVKNSGIQFKNNYAVFNIDGNNAIHLYQKSDTGTSIRGLEITSSLNQIYNEVADLRMNASGIAFNSSGISLTEGLGVSDPSVILRVQEGDYLNDFYAGFPKTNEYLQFTRDNGLHAFWVEGQGHLHIGNDGIDLVDSNSLVNIQIHQTGSEVGTKGIRIYTQAPDEDGGEHKRAKFSIAPNAMQFEFGIPEQLEGWLGLGADGFNMQLNDSHGVVFSEILNGDTHDTTHIDASGNRNRELFDNYGWAVSRRNSANTTTLFGMQVTEENWGASWDNGNGTTGNIGIDNTAFVAASHAGGNNYELRVSKDSFAWDGSTESGAAYLHVDANEFNFNSPSVQLIVDFQRFTWYSFDQEESPYNTFFNISSGSIIYEAASGNLNFDSSDLRLNWPKEGSDVDTYKFSAGKSGLKLDASIPNSPEKLEFDTNVFTYENSTGTFVTDNGGLRYQLMKDGQEEASFKVDKDNVYYDDAPLLTSSYYGSVVDWAVGDAQGFIRVKAASPASTDIIVQNEFTWSENVYAGAIIPALGILPLYTFITMPGINRIGGVYESSGQMGCFTKYNYQMYELSGDGFGDNLYEAAIIGANNDVYCFQGNYLKPWDVRDGKTTASPGYTGKVRGIEGPTALNGTPYNFNWSSIPTFTSDSEDQWIPKGSMSHPLENPFMPDNVVMFCNTQAYLQGNSRFSKPTVIALDKRTRTWGRLSTSATNFLFNENCWCKATCYAGNYFQAFSTPDQVWISMFAYISGGYDNNTSVYYPGSYFIYGLRDTRKGNGSAAARPIDVTQDLALMLPEHRYFYDDSGTGKKFYNYSFINGCTYRGRMKDGKRHIVLWGQTDIGDQDSGLHNFTGGVVLDLTLPEDGYLNNAWGTAGTGQYRMFNQAIQISPEAHYATVREAVLTPDGSIVFIYNTTAQGVAILHPDNTVTRIYNLLPQINNSPSVYLYGAATYDQETDCVLIVGSPCGLRSPSSLGTTQFTPVIRISCQSWKIASNNAVRVSIADNL